MGAKDAESAFRGIWKHVLVNLYGVSNAPIAQRPDKFIIVLLDVHLFLDKLFPSLIQATASFLVFASLVSSSAAGVAKRIL